jgi:hypothetical protein
VTGSVLRNGVVGTAVLVASAVAVAMPFRVVAVPADWAGLRENRFYLLVRAHAVAGRQNVFYRRVHG